MKRACSAIQQRFLPIDRGLPELRRCLSNYEAEYGRNSGAVINIVTKSGTKPAAWVAD